MQKKSKPILIKVAIALALAGEVSGMNSSSDLHESFDNNKNEQKKYFFNKVISQYCYFNYLDKIKWNNDLNDRIYKKYDIINSLINKSIENKCANNILEKNLNIPFVDHTIKKFISNNKFFSNDIVERSIINMFYSDVESFIDVHEDDFQVWCKNNSIFEKKFETTNEPICNFNGSNHTNILANRNQKKPARVNSINLEKAIIWHKVSEKKEEAKNCSDNALETESYIELKNEKLEECEKMKIIQSQNYKFEDSSDCFDSDDLKTERSNEFSSRKIELSDNEYFFVSQVLSNYADILDFLKNNPTKNLRYIANEMKLFEGHVGECTKNLVEVGDNTESLINEIDQYIRIKNNLSNTSNTILGNKIHFIECLIPKNSEDFNNWCMDNKNKQYISIENKHKLLLAYRNWIEKSNESNFSERVKQDAKKIELLHFDTDCSEFIYNNMNEIKNLNKTKLSNINIAKKIHDFIYSIEEIDYSDRDIIHQILNEIRNFVDNRPEQYQQCLKQIEFGKIKKNTRFDENEFNDLFEIKSEFERKEYHGDRFGNFLFANQRGIESIQALSQDLSETNTEIEASDSENQKNISIPESDSYGSESKILEDKTFDDNASYDYCEDVESPDEQSKDYTSNDSEIENLHYEILFELFKEEIIEYEESQKILFTNSVDNIRRKLPLKSLKKERYDYCEDVESPDEQSELNSALKYRENISKQSSIESFRDNLDARKENIDLNLENSKNISLRQIIANNNIIKEFRNTPKFLLQAQYTRQILSQVYLPSKLETKPSIRESSDDFKDQKDISLPIYVPVSTYIQKNVSIESKDLAASNFMKQKNQLFNFLHNLIKLDKRKNKDKLFLNRIIESFDNFIKNKQYMKASVSFLNYFNKFARKVHTISGNKKISLDAMKKSVFLAKSFQKEILDKIQKKDPEQYQGQLDAWKKILVNINYAIQLKKKMQVRKKARKIKIKIKKNLNVHKKHAQRFIYPEKKRKIN